MTDGMVCPHCETQHTQWEFDGKYAVGGPASSHSGYHERYECGKCAEITEVARR